MSTVNYQNISEETICKELSPIFPTVYTVIELAQSIVPECIDIYEKKGSLGTMVFTVFEVNYRNQRGEAVARGRWTSIRIPTPEVDDYEGKKVD